MTELFRCQTCDNPTPNDELNRINPPPYDELIVCDMCYDWKAWKYLSEEKDSVRQRPS